MLGAGASSPSRGFWPQTLQLPREGEARVCALEWGLDGTIVVLVGGEAKAGGVSRSLCRARTPERAEHLNELTAIYD